jgi:hypothetical protein
MKRSDVCKIALLVGWLAAFGGLSIVSSLQVHAAPAPACHSCTCKNVWAYKAVGDAPEGPKLAWKKQTGAWEVTTHAFVGMLTGDECDDPNTTETTWMLAWTDVSVEPNCAVPPLPPGQTVKVQCAQPGSPGNPPNVATTTAKRWVCAP